MLSVVHGCLFVFSSLITGAEPVAVIVYMIQYLYWHVEDYTLNPKMSNFQKT